MKITHAQKLRLLACLILPVLFWGATFYGSILPVPLGRGDSLESAVANANRETGPGNVASALASTAVFAQAPDPASDIAFVFRQGAGILAGFGLSAVYYALGITTLHVTFPGSQQVAPRGLGPLGSTTNYLLGQDPAGWRAGLADYAAVIYKDLYPGIDLRYAAAGGALKYEFIIAPGADPSQIAVAFANADTIEVSGDAVHATVKGENFADTDLVAFQDTNTGRVEVSCAFLRADLRAVSFRVGRYDPTVPLVIDPVVNLLEYSTYLGGTGNDYGYSIAVDASGCAYITGSTSSDPFRTTAGAFNETYSGGEWPSYCDAFVAKFAASGASLAYCTYLGGTGNDWGHDIAVDARGCAYVIGITSSTDFPATSLALQTSNGGYDDAFVAKFAASGVSLAFCTYLGGTGNEWGEGIAIDLTGCVYITGTTTSSDLPATLDAVQKSYGGGDWGDAFMARIEDEGESLAYCTYLGGAGDDFGEGIAIDSSNCAHIIGYTSSNPFNVTIGAFDTAFGGGDYDAFIAKFGLYGASLAYCAYFGGDGNDYITDIAIDAKGCAFIVGYTGSSNLPTTASAFQPNYSGSSDAFVAKIIAGGVSLAYCTYLGGRGSEMGLGIAVDACGCVYIAGDTSSSDFPITTDMSVTTFGGSSNYDDAFVAVLTPSFASVAYCTFLGGQYNDSARAIAIDASGSTYVTGHTQSSNFPITSGAFDTAFNGGYDGFVAKLTSDVDHDNMLDGWEVSNGLDMLFNDATQDPDGDDLTNLQEYQGKMNPQEVDTDGDGMPDGWEVANEFNPIASEAQPVLGYSTYLGGAGTEVGYSIAVDSSGCMYVTGVTNSNPFNTTASAFDTEFGGGLTNYDAFVAKFAADGASLVYCTYLGGAEVDYSYGIAIDTSKYAYITGYTISDDFPTTPGVFDRTLTGQSDVFVTKLAVNGASLAYSTYLGGEQGDYGRDIAVDASGCVYITGYTSSNPFNTTGGAFDTTYGGNNPYTDVFVAKFAANGASLAYCTYLGGASNDFGYGIAVDFSGCAFVTGYTFSNPFNTTANAFDTLFGGSSNDAFVAQFAADGSSLVYCTYLGGAGVEHSNSVAVDAIGCAYVTGYTTSSDFPATGGAFDTTYDDNYDIFVAKIVAGGVSLAYCTYLGGSGTDNGEHVAVDEHGRAFITGYTASSPFNTTSYALQSENAGGEDAFVAQISEDGALLVYCTCIGGVTNDRGLGIAVSDGNIYLAGMTLSSDFPTTLFAFDRTRDGTSQDGFIAKISIDGDRDGMPNNWESMHGLNLAIDDALFDIDHDSLTNAQEYTCGTGPQLADTDGDGMPDGWEVTNSINPLADDAGENSDGDGLTNAQEYAIGTDPKNPDTDGDGFSDGAEETAGTDPLNGASYPAEDTQSETPVLTTVDNILLGITIGLTIVSILAIMIALRTQRSLRQITQNQTRDPHLIVDSDRTHANTPKSTLPTSPEKPPSSGGKSPKNTGKAPKSETK